MSDLCVTRKLAWCMFACMLKLHADIREILSLGNINCEIPLWNSVTLCRLCIHCLSNQGSCILHNYRFTDYLVEKRKVHLGKHWCILLDYNTCSVHMSGSRTYRICFLSFLLRGLANLDASILFYSALDTTKWGNFKG